jgi:AraC-like DNA-binding protein
MINGGLKLLGVAEWERLAHQAGYRPPRLARLCGTSLRQVQREFQRTFAMSPRDWLSVRRVAVAREMLQAGFSIKAVSCELGFKQVSHFCRLFKAHSHLTPSEFLARMDGRRQPCRPEITDVVGG